MRFSILLATLLFLSNSLFAEDSNDKREFRKMRERVTTEYRDALRDVQYYKVERCEKDLQESEANTGGKIKKHFRNRRMRFYSAEDPKNKARIQEIADGLKGTIALENELLQKYPNAPQEDKFWEVVRTYGTWFEPYKPRFFLAALYLCDRTGALGTPEVRKKLALEQIDMMARQLESRIKALEAEDAAKNQGRARPKESRALRGMKEELQDLNSLRSRVEALSGSEPTGGFAGSGDTPAGGGFGGTGDGPKE